MNKEVLILLIKNNTIFRIEDIYENKDEITFFTNKKPDFNLLKDRMPQFDYSDITNMELYYSLNIVNYSDGYASFITKLPYEKEVALQPQQVIQEQIIKEEKD